MKYYIDTEFIESQNYLELISIGIKCEDGRTFYAESNEVDFAKANDWVKENVIPNLVWFDLPNYNPKHDCSFEMYGTKKEIAKEIINFISYHSEPPVFYGYYADYDWVLFCWLFGAMLNLPIGWPMYCRDLKQMLDETGIEIDKISSEHNALADAIWNEELHKKIKKEAIRLCGVSLGS